MSAKEYCNLQYHFLLWSQIRSSRFTGTPITFLGTEMLIYYFYFDICWINVEYIYIATYLLKYFDSWFCLSLQHSSKEYICEDQLQLLWPHMPFCPFDFQLMLLKHWFCKLKDSKDYSPWEKQDIFPHEAGQGTEKFGKSPFMAALSNYVNITYRPNLPEIPFHSLFLSHTPRVVYWLPYLHQNVVQI